MNRASSYSPGIAGFWKVLLVAAVLTVAGMAKATPLRVTTWDIEPNLAAGTSGTSKEYHDNLMREAAEVLTKLHPDVVILQGVPDWQSCNGLVKALKPAKYNIAGWSSFRDPNTGRLSERQTAILSKNKAYISWSEAWKEENAAAAAGGFTFAAIKIGSRRAGFFSVQLGANNLLGGDGRSDVQRAAREASARQLLSQLDSLNKWTTNRVDALVLAGDFNTGADEPALADEKTLPLLEQSGFADAFAGLPLEKRTTLPGSSSYPDATADYVFCRDTKPLVSPEITQAALTEHYPVTCELDIDTQSVPAPEPAPLVQSSSSKSPPLPTQSAPTSLAHAAPPVLATPPQVSQNPLRIAWFAMGGVLLLAIILKLIWRRAAPKPVLLAPLKEPAALPVPAQEGVVIAQQPGETTGSATDNPPIVHIEATIAGESQSWPGRGGQSGRRAERMKEMERQGLMAHLSEWLKAKIVQRLAMDRAQLLDAQQTAVAKMQVVDARLAKIESQLQERNRIYEKRITELEKELTVAREENRELIRARIAQVKADMEKDRLEAERRSREKS